MNNIAGIFAGQGAQAVGMGKDLAEAHKECAEIFSNADDILGFSLSKICFEGPAEDLTKTNICKPAIFVMSAAYLTALRKLRPGLEFGCVAGLVSESGQRSGLPEPFRSRIPLRFWKLAAAS